MVILDAIEKRVDQASLLRTKISHNQNKTAKLKINGRHTVMKILLYIKTSNSIYLVNPDCVNPCFPSFVIIFSIQKQLLFPFDWHIYHRRVAFEHGLKNTEEHLALTRSMNVLLIKFNQQSGK